jgi:hypothetical protein
MLEIDPSKIDENVPLKIAENFVKDLPNTLPPVNFKLVATIDAQTGIYFQSNISYGP